MKAYLVRIFLCLLTCALVGGLAAARTIEFETTEVTAADVTVSPDGQWLIFTLLGHLFRLPVEGGTAEQLTFGPYYDTDPVFSPDGTRVAFVSDRDGSQGNIFVLELVTGQITQITWEPWAGRLAWSPEGQAITYLAREELSKESSVVRRVSLAEGKSETISAPARLFRSVFYLPDGRLGWSVIERGSTSEQVKTRLEVLSPQGTVLPLRTFKGFVDRLEPSAKGDGFYCRWYLPAARAYLPHPEDLRFVPLLDRAQRRILPLSNPRGDRPRFAVSPDAKSIYLGEAGRLWKIALPSDIRTPISFNARVRMEIKDPLPPPKLIFPPVGTSVRPRTIVDPRLSPDGRLLVFGAAGYLWQQSVGGGTAQRLFEGEAFETDPVFSPDGRQLAFVRTQQGKEEVIVFEFGSRRTRTLASGSSYSSPNWSGDGRRVVFIEAEGPSRRIVAVDISDGSQQILAEPAPVWGWWPRPHLSTDGQWLYFSGGPGSGVLYRVDLGEETEPEPITQLTGDLWNGLVSLDGKWLVFWRQMGIWVAPLDSVPVREEHVRQLTLEGGDAFTIAPGGQSLIYVAGNRVWRQRLAGGEPEEISIRLELPRPVPRPLLLRRVRVLDFALGRFGPETSLFIEEGRIRWLGSEDGHELPAETDIIDAGARFAIPGLFEMHGHNLGGFTDGETFLAYGVTSVRDVGDWIVRTNALADRSDASMAPLPRYFYAGDAVSNWIIYREEDAQTYIPRWKEWGAQFIKIHPPISWPLQLAVAEEARRLGLPVVAHGTTIEEITRGVTLGFSFLEHTLNHNRSYDDILQFLAAAGTRWDPTLIAGGYSDLLLRDEPERLDDPKFQAFIPSWCIQHARAGSFMGTTATTTLRGRWADQLAGIRAAHHRGVKLHAGTDVSCLIPQSVGSVGLSLHWELEFFAQAGIPPLEVLRIATQQAAAAVGAEGDLGALEPGKLADMVLLDKNPLDDIRNTQTIWRVIKGGWLFDPEKLRPPASTSPDE